MKVYRLNPAGVRATEHSELHIARRGMATSAVSSPDSEMNDSDDDLPWVCLYAGAGPVQTPLPDACRPNEPVPIWLAALLAAPCEARRNGENHAIRWDFVSGRALYTNAGREAEHIEPLGVNLMGGHTMAVCWMPGDTTYTVEVYRQAELCA